MKSSFVVLIVLATLFQGVFAQAQQVQACFIQGRDGMMYQTPCRSARSYECKGILVIGLPGYGSRTQDIPVAGLSETSKVEAIRELKSNCANQLLANRIPNGQNICAGWSEGQQFRCNAL